MMNSFCPDEVSASLARCGRLKSDGEILVNDELRGDTSFSLRLLWIISSAYSCIMRSMQKRLASPAVAMKILQLKQRRELLHCQLIIHPVWLIPHQLISAIAMK